MSGMIVETRGGKPTRFSRPLRTVGLKAEDVRQFGKVFSLRDVDAVKGILSVGLRGKDLQLIQHDNRVGRREAVRTYFSEFLTNSESEMIKGIKNTPGRE